MKSLVTTPPAILETQAYGLSDVALSIPAMVLIIPDEKVNVELVDALKNLDERVKTLSSKARNEGNERRVIELRYYEEKMIQLENIVKVECVENSEMMSKVKKGFQRMYERVLLEIGQFEVSGNVRRVVEMDYVLDDLKKLKAKAAKYGIVL